MRSYLILLIFLFNLTAIPAKSEDVVLGRVASIDRESGEVILHLTEQPGTEDGQKEDDDIPKAVIVQFAPGRLPGYISVGETIRVWGEYPSESQSVFQVQNIGKKLLQRPKSDPTGVRRRLGRHKGNMMRRDKRPPRRPPKRHR